MENNTAHIEYWNKEWKRREAESSGLPSLNIAKAEKLLMELWTRLHYFNLEKLEIGCGPGIHAYKIGAYSSMWKETWTGIDISEEAVRIAKSRGLNAYCTDIKDFASNGKKFQVFLLLDVLEHLEDYENTADKICQLSKVPYYVFLNVPLYLSMHEENTEHMVSIREVRRFITLCGCTAMREQIYGISGWPYMLAEGERIA